MEGTPTHLSQLLDRATTRRPNATAVKDQHDLLWNYVTLSRLADRLATRLARWGIGRGDRVGMMLYPCVESIASMLGVARAGATCVPVDANSSFSHASGTLSACAVRAVVVGSSLAPELALRVRDRGPQPRLIVVEQGITARLGSRDTSWPEIQADTAPSPLPPEREPDDQAWITCRVDDSGTIKQCSYSHANVLAQISLRGSDTRGFASTAALQAKHSLLDVYRAIHDARTIVLEGKPALVGHPTKGPIGKHLRFDRAVSSETTHGQGHARITGWDCEFTARLSH